MSTTETLSNMPPRDSFSTLSTSSLDNSSTRSTPSTPLPRLDTASNIAVLPQQQLDARAQALSFIKRIDRVEVHNYLQDQNQRSPPHSFTIDIYWNLRSLGTDSPTGLARPNTDKPDLQVEHIVADFQRLRDAIVTAANASHNVQWCRFCAEIDTHPLLKLKLDARGLSRLFHSHQDESSNLQAFLTCILHLTSRLPLRSHHDRRLCIGQTEIPQLLQDFLLPSLPTLQGDTDPQPSHASPLQAASAAQHELAAPKCTSIVPSLHESTIGVGVRVSIGSFVTRCIVRSC